MRIVAAAMAMFISPVERFRNTAIGSVSVFILVAPATIRMAPNSPVAFDQVMIVPAAILSLAIGRAIF